MLTVCARLLAVALFMASFPCAQAREAGVLRWWWNDNRDSGDTIGSVAAMENCSDGVVNGNTDREDFLALALNLQPFVAAWGGRGVDFVLSGDGSMNAVFTDLEPAHSGWIRTSSDFHAGPELNVPFDRAPVLPIDQAGVVIPPLVVERLRTQNIVMAAEFLPGERQLRTLRFLAKAGDKVLYSFPFQFQVSDVRDMYRWINLRHLSGEQEIDPTDSHPPRNADWSDDLTNVFFIHGANVTEQDSRVWFEKMFKRLYLAGAWMRFHGISWRSMLGAADEYHVNASNSYEIAAAVANTVNAVPGRKVVIAHSLGTMVAANAVQYFDMAVDKLIFLNSAIPSEAIDDAFFDPSPTNRLVHDSWTGYTNACWTALYHNLADGDSDRAKLTWRDRYPNVSALLFNMYSSGDEVLELYDGGGNPGWSDGVWTSAGKGSRYAWHKQELWKGRKSILARFGTTDWSGWGHKTGVFGWGGWSVAAANAVTDPRVFATNTVFNPHPSSITNSVLTEAEINAHLTQGIPALSPALGRTDVSRKHVVSFDLNVDDVDYRKNGWPRNDEDFHENWLHSDIKDVAYYYTFQAFRILVENGGLR